MAALATAIMSAPWPITPWASEVDQIAPAEMIGTESPTLSENHSVSVRGSSGNSDDLHEQSQHDM